MEFVEVFENRRKEFEFALTIHTAVGVDEANIKLNAVDKRTVELDRKYVPKMLVICSTTDNWDQDGSDAPDVPKVRHS